jgi:hypothetical protein
MEENKKPNNRKDGLTMSFSNIENIKSDFNNRLVSKKTHGEFNIDGYTVIALNKKNALRKIEKLKKDK